jgi:ATP-dependent Clp protease ATP-binding subunit ClpC
MASANHEAKRLRHEYIDGEHILLGLLEEGAGVGAHALRELGIDLQDVRLELEKLRSPPSDVVLMGSLPVAPWVKTSIIEEARQLNHDYVGTAHLLLGLMRQRQSAAVWVLTGLGHTTEAVRREVLTRLSAEPGYDEDAPTPGS